ncbi:MAG: hypothetical protein ACJAT2_002539 [Bacteriovoracaceae bacterium]|jgi:hypothetical protein
MIVKKTMPLYHESMKISLILSMLLTSHSLFAIEEKEPLKVMQMDEKTDALKAKDSVFSKDNWKNVHLQANLDTLSYKSLDKELEVDWSLEFGNVDQENIEYLLKYSHTYDRQVDLFSKTVVRETSVNISQEFDVNKILGHVGYTSDLSLIKTKENDIYVQKYNAELAPLGIKWDIYENDTLTELSLSYLPTYNYLEHYDPDVDALGNPVVNKIVERALLHVFKFNIGVSYGNFTFTEEARWKEIKPFDKANAANRDFLFTNEIKLSYALNDYMSISYKNSVLVDKRRKEVQDLPSTDHQHNFSFGLNWN